MPLLIVGTLCPAAWGQRSWEFAVGLLMLQLWPQVGFDKRVLFSKRFASGFPAQSLHWPRLAFESQTSTCCSL